MIETFDSETLKEYVCMFCGAEKNVKIKVKVKTPLNKTEPEHKYQISDVFKSIDMRHYFNNMEFDEFYKLIYPYIDMKQMRKNHMTRKEWKFTGLINTDFVMMFCDEKECTCIKETK